MVSLRCEDSSTIFSGLSLDEDFSSNFLENNFTYGDSNISYSLTPLVVFYQLLMGSLETDEQKDLWHEMYQTLHEAHISYINIEN
jgi:hypothetical protein